MADRDWRHPAGPIAPAPKREMPRVRRGRTAGRRGVALVVVLVIVLVLVSTLLVFARQMQTEAVAARNSISQLQARSIAEGVVQAVIADLAQSIADGDAPDVDTMDVQAGRLGDGLYWIVKPATDDDQHHEWGVVREAGRVNINSADADMLSRLPGMTDELAAAIVDWRDSDTETSTNGAESAYYLVMSDPYIAKDGPFETVRELLLVRDMDDEILFGEDGNLNGVLDDNENDAGALPPADDGDGQLDAGLFPFITVYSREPNTSIATGEQRVNVNEARTSQLTDALRAVLSSERATVLASQIRSQRPYTSTLDCYVRNHITADEASLLEDRITTTGDQTLVGRIDVTSASATVLDALPGLEAGDGDKLVAARTQNTSTVASLLWMVDAVGREKALAAARMLTTRCYQFSADIVAVSGDGRGFCRLKVVIDASPSQQTSPRVVYARDLTALGWPLDSQILDDLRSGVTADELAAQTLEGISE